MRSKCGWYHSRTRCTWPRPLPLRIRERSPCSSPSLRQCTPSACGTVKVFSELRTRSLAPRNARSPCARSPDPCPAAAAARGRRQTVLRGLSAQRSTAIRSLTCAASRNFEAAVLHERNLAPRELHFEHVAVARAAEQHGLPLAAARWLRAVSALRRRRIRPAPAGRRR